MTLGYDYDVQLSLSAVLNVDKFAWRATGVLTIGSLEPWALYVFVIDYNSTHDHRHHHERQRPQNLACLFRREMYQHGFPVVLHAEHWG
jgi:hypothetical protein